MKLYIDTSDSMIIKVGLNREIIREDAKREQSQRLLRIIDRELRKRNKTSKDISGIQVNTGPGSFTGLRIGVAVANALGWSLNVPVNGCLPGKEQVKIYYK